MEAVRDFISPSHSGPVHSGPERPTPAPDRVTFGSGRPGVESALGLLRDVSSTAVADSALWGFADAAEFAGCVEELSRRVEYLQLVAAAAVDRIRKQAGTVAGPGGSHPWTTGWLEPASLPASTTDKPAELPADKPEDKPAGLPADDGYRNTTEYLRARLRIGASEARRRLSLADRLLPRRGLAGQPLPAERAELGAAVADGEVATRSAGIVSAALDRVRHACSAEDSKRMELALTRTAAENDPDFLMRVARSWADAMDQDGAEPSEELLHQLQGAFVRRPFHGLHRVDIFATAEQFEQLLTVMNVATNPRGSTPMAGPSSSPSRLPDHAVNAADAHVTTGEGAAAPKLDWRSRAQRLLDGLVGACRVALASGSLPATGGLRPQVMVTIAYKDLLTRLLEPGGMRTGSGSGTLPFTGPVSASAARKIACDADLIPVVLGGESRVLDIGRASRVFPPHIRKAITARDLGCAFPGCAIPASWCEAHHISYWSRGGTTGTDNGTLLCSHHHHIIHKEQWTIEVRTGLPWFIPPPHIDPRRRARRNYFFRPDGCPGVGLPLPDP